MPVTIRDADDEAPEDARKPQLFGQLTAAVAQYKEPQ